jgi:hypothetical protein
MIILLQLVIFCLLYIGMVKAAVRDSGRNCLYFYPKDYIVKANELGVAMFVALIMFISL